MFFKRLLYAKHCRPGGSASECILEGGRKGSTLWYDGDLAVCERCGRSVYGGDAAWTGKTSLLALAAVALCSALIHSTPCPSNSLWQMTLAEPASTLHSAFHNNRSRNRQITYIGTMKAFFWNFLKNSLFCLEAVACSHVAPIRREPTDVGGRNEAVLLGEGVGEQSPGRPDSRCVIGLGCAWAPQRSSLSIHRSFV